MEKKVILITGGSSGIGKAIGIFLTQKGYLVYGTTRNLRKYTDFQYFKLLEMDVQKPATIASCISTVITLEGRLDVVINNAGIGITGPLEETPLVEIENNFATNFYGPLQVIREVLPQMRAQHGGTIINITSIAGYMGLPFRGVYSASKGALELITESLSMETKPFGIHCVALAPGDFATNIAEGRYHAPLLAESPYKEIYGNTLATINEGVKAGGNPEKVARLVYKIINTKNPRIHYKVGSFLQKFSVVLKRILPSTWFEKLLLNHSS